jgi:hypothetical protein
VRSDADQMFTAMHDELADRHLLGFGESIAQHGVASSASSPSGKGSKASRNSGCRSRPVDEAGHIDGVLGFELERVNLLGFDETWWPLVCS